MAKGSNIKKTNHKGKEKNTNKKVNISKMIKTTKTNILLTLKPYLNKKGVFIGAIVLAVILLMVFAITNIVSELKDNPKESKISANVNTEVIQNTDFKGLKLSNISLIRNKETKQYTFTAYVTNTTKEKINVKQVDIVLKNKKGEELITLLGDIGQDGLEANATKTITASVSDSIDLSKATTKEIKEHQNK